MSIGTSMLIGTSTGRFIAPVMAPTGLATAAATEVAAVIGPAAAGIAVEVTAAATEVAAGIGAAAAAAIADRQAKIGRGEQLS
jgi:hypothetical protein